ncbi:type IV conjugative transfer system coupling protein TraD [Ursidibacter arcticus]
MSNFDARNVTQGGQVLKYMIAMFVQIMNVVSYWSAILAALSFVVYMAVVTNIQQAKHGIVYLYVKHIAVYLSKLNPDVMNNVYEFDWAAKSGGVHHLTRTYAQILDDRYFQQVGRILQLDLFWGLGVFILVFFGTMMIAFFYLGRKGKAQRKNDMIGGRYLAKSVSEVNRLLKSQDKLSPFKIGDLHLVKNSEIQNIAVHGTLGTGKSTTFNDFLSKGRELNQRAIIYDKGCTFITIFYREGKDVILNPMDARCPNWDLWEECQDKVDLENFAIPLLPDKDGDPFWTLSARNLFVSTAEAMRNDPERSIRKLLNILLNIPLNDLRQYVSEQDAASLVEGSIEKTAITIRAVLGTYARSLRLCQGLDEKGGEKFSISRWVRNADDDAWIFLSSDGRVHESIKPLITAWLNVAMQNVLALKPDLQRRIWTILDELNSLHRLPMLLEYMSEARKFGGVTVLGLQSFAQIESNYGRETARAIWDLVNTVAFFRAPSGEIAEWVQNELGEIQHLKFKDQYSYGADSIRDGVNFTKDDIRENIVSYSNIQNLNDLECYVSLLGDMPVVKVKLERKTYTLIAEGKYERDLSNVFNPEQDKLINQATMMNYSDNLASKLVKNYGKPQSEEQDSNAATDSNGGGSEISLDQESAKELALHQGNQFDENPEHQQKENSREIDRYQDLTNNGARKQHSEIKQAESRMDLDY